MNNVKVDRQAPPALEWRSPDCTICGKETSHDGDSLYCEDCHAYWPDDNDEGEWNNETAGQCASTHQPSARNQFANGEPWQFETVRCMLDVGHAGKHRADVINEWTDQSAVNGLGPAPEEEQ